LAPSASLDDVDDGCPCGLRHLGSGAALRIIKVVGERYSGKSRGLCLRDGADSALLVEAMEIVTTIDEIRKAIRRREGSRTVFVPTMGALHEGHRAMMEEARELAGEDGVLVASVFVNPTQFASGEDFEIYPRDLEMDAALCEETEVDLLFAPPVSELYAGDASCRVIEDYLSRHLCGESRPGHFSGVCTVVAKLFNIIQPDFALFGKKDRQQLAIIERMVRDLCFPVEIVGVETVREEDGLAMSSRNRYLSDEERAAAIVLPQSLHGAQALYFEGERDAAALRRHVERHLESSPLARIDYVEVVDSVTMQPVAKVNGAGVVAAAVFFGQSRLIDNVELDPVACVDESNESVAMSRSTSL